MIFGILLYTLMLYGQKLWFSNYRKSDNYWSSKRLKSPVFHNESKLANISVVNKIFQSIGDVVASFIDRFVIQQPVINFLSSKTRFILKILKS